MKKKGSFGRKIEPYLYLFPAFFFLIMFTYYPFIKNAWLSVNRVDQFRRIKGFAGLANYVRIFEDGAFWQAVGNTFIYVLLTVPIAMVIGYLLACLARKKRKCSTIYEVLFALSMATSDAVIAMIFQLLYNPSFGNLNKLLGLNIAWLTDEKYALLSLMIIQIWHNVGYNFLFMLSAQRNIPTDVMESAKMDGVSGFKMQQKIIFPLVTPMVFFLFIKDIAYGMTVANYTLILTGGGPNGSTQTIITYIYSKAITSTNYNFAFAATMVGFLISAVLISISMTFEKKVNYN